MASGAGAPDERPPGDGSPPGKPPKAKKPRTASAAISVATLKKHGILVIRAKPQDPCSAAKKQTARKCGWYVGDEGYECIDVESSPEEQSRMPTHVIFLSSDSEQSSTPGSPSRSSTPCGETRSMASCRQRLPLASPIPDNSSSSSSSSPTTSANSEPHDDTPDELPLVVAWPLGTTPPPHIRDPTALMWGLSPGENANDTEMERESSDIPPENYIEVPWSSPERLADDTMESDNAEECEDPCSD